jgi:hypothetical protein
MGDLQRISVEQKVIPRAFVKIMLRERVELGLQCQPEPTWKGAQYQVDSLAYCQGFIFDPVIGRAAIHQAIHAKTAQAVQAFAAV